MTLGVALDTATASLRTLPANTARQLNVLPEVVSGVHLHAARRLLAAREAGERKLAELEGDELQDLDDGERFLLLAGYLAAKWCIYDLVADFLAHVSLDKAKARAAKGHNIVALYFEKNERKKTLADLPVALRDVVTQRFAPALCASYALRNALMHQGLVLHSASFGRAFTPTPEFKDLVRRGAHGIGGAEFNEEEWDANDFRNTLGALTTRCDEGVATLLVVAARRFVQECEAAHGLLA